MYKEIVIGLLFILQVSGKSWTSHCEAFMEKVEKVENHGLEQLLIDDEEFMKKFEICKSLLGIDEDYADYENEITDGIGIEQDQDAFVSRSWNTCQLKLFNQENFRGTQTRIMRKKKKITRGRKKYSLQSRGSCCWEIYSRGKHWKTVRPNTEFNSLRKSLKTPFYVQRKTC